MRLGIAVVNHNQRAEVLALLSEIEQQSSPKVMVFLLEHDCLVEERVKKDLQRFTFEYDYLSIDEWLTFAGTANIQLDKAQSAGIDGLWFVPSNASFRPGVIGKVQKMLTRTKVGVWGIHGGWVGNDGQILPVRNRTLMTGRQEVKVDWVMKEGMLISLEAAKEVGRFDLRFYQEGEEVDYCLRMKAAGYECCLWGGEQVEGLCDRKVIKQPLTNYFRHRNWVLLAGMRAKDGHEWRRGVWLCIRHLVPKSLVEWAKMKQRKSLLMAWEGMRDGLRILKEDYSG